MYYSIVLCTAVMAHLCVLNQSLAENARIVPNPKEARSGSKLQLVIAENVGAMSSGECGLYCVYANAKYYGIALDLDKLFDAKYLSGTYGCNSSDLSRCAADFGLVADNASTFDLLDLWLIERPIMALVKNTLDGKVYNHWVLVTDVDLDGVTVYDPSAFSYDPAASLPKVSLAEFQSIWGGVGFVFVPGQGEFIQYKMARWATFAVKVLMLFGFMYSFVLLRPYFNTRFVNIAIPAVAIGFAVLYHVGLPIGFAANAKQINALTLPSRDRVEPLSPDAFAKRREQSVIIDVRYTVDYQISHIPGAVNIPINSSDLAFLAYLSKVSLDTPLVFYCQSRNCPWAQAAASRKIFNSYQRIYILEGGMQAYDEFWARRKPKE